jgi:hypothetical protein
MIASIINSSDLNFDTPFKYASSVLSIVVLVILAIATGTEIYLIRANQGGLQLEEFISSYGAIIEGLDTSRVTRIIVNYYITR